MKKNKTILIVFLFLLLPLTVFADTWGQRTEFFVDSFYDKYSRDRLTATLRKISPRVYFYIEDDLWNSLNFDSQDRILKAIETLASEFESKIYPTLTSNFGFEWKPGIDRDERITILIHQMGKDVGGYFNFSDEYSKFQAPTSNEREMIYLNSFYIDKEIVKSYLAHEFLHLITFNQKDKIHGVSEEVWLNEARTEYASTLLGYDEIFEGSNLEKRFEEFFKNPSDSLTEWKNKKEDYAITNVFAQYLVDHYGKEILIDSLKSPKTGILSIEEVLKKNRFSEDFSQIFTDWTIAIFVQDCSLGEKYCYKNQNLKKYFVLPSTYYLPFVKESSLSITNYTKEWAGNWYKIVGGRGNLRLEFSGQKGVEFKVPYLIIDKTGKKEIKFLELDREKKGEIYLPDFSDKISSLILIPSVQSKISDFSSSEPVYHFSFVVSTNEKMEEKGELIKKLLAQIEFLKKEIAGVQTQINEILANREENPVSCQKFNNNLYYGMRNNLEVRCLQEFLKSQGPEIYPEGLVTGNFLDLTRRAVVRFQEKYASEILIPLGLEKGTGYVGLFTRAKINHLLK